MSEQRKMQAMLLAYAESSNTCESQHFPHIYDFDWEYINLEDEYPEDSDESLIVRYVTNSQLMTIGCVKINIFHKFPKFSHISP